MIFLDLLELERRYNDVLISTARGFELGHEFLDIWVPGVVKDESVKNFFEATKIYNVEKKFGLTINKKSISEKDLNKIKSLTKDYTVKVKNEILEIKLV